MKSGTSILLVLLVLASGCTSRFAGHRRQIERAHAMGHYEQIAEALDEAEPLYSSHNRQLWLLDRAATALALSDNDAVIGLLEESERRTEHQSESDSADEFGKWALNDRAAAYVPAPYEDIYVNVFKLLAHLESGTIEGGATVEARRLARKSDRLRDEYARELHAIRRDAARILDRTETPERIRSQGDGGAFIESTLGAYLTAVTFMSTRDREFQRVAGKRLQQAIAFETGSLDAGAFTTIGERPLGTGDLLVVALSGRGPTKVAARFGPLLIDSTPIYVELPDVIANWSRIDRTAVEVRNGPTFDLYFVEDFGETAAANHRRLLPLVYARTLVRASIKAGIATVVGETVEDHYEGGDWDDALIVVATKLAGLFYVAATEQADLRTWAMLPGQAHAGIIDLGPGEHDVRVVYIDRSGARVHATPWTHVTTGADHIRTVVSHYWN